MRPHEAEVSDKLLANLDYFEITREIAKQAGEIKFRHTRRGRTLSLRATAAIIVSASGSRHCRRMIPLGWEDCRSTKRLRGNIHIPISLFYFLPSIFTTSPSTSIACCGLVYSIPRTTLPSRNSNRKW